jgi:hypothetical protein
MPVPLDERYTPEQLAETIQAYFQECTDAKEYPGTEGLAYAIGVTRRTLEAYMAGEGKREQSPIYEALSLAGQYIRSQDERGLKNEKACTGFLFSLKNTAGGYWRDEHSVKQDLTVNDFRGLFAEVQGSIITGPALVSDDSSEDTGT